MLWHIHRRKLGTAWINLLALERRVEFAKGLIVAGNNHVWPLRCAMVMKFAPSLA